MSNITMAPSTARIHDIQGTVPLIPGYPQAGPSTSASDIGKTARKPWADEPWPLIETPSNTQHITHPASYIANEMAHAHNATLRGLNAIFLQAPHARRPDDAADLLFLARAWSAWALDHHALKQTALLPAFERVLRLEPGALSCEEAPGEGDGGDDVAALLRHVHAYASEATEYDSRALQSLLVALAARLAPLLARQVAVLAGMRELCSPSSSSPGTTSSTAAAAAAEEERTANALLRVYLSCSARASDVLDRSVMAPMILGLRDATFEGGRGRDWPGLSVPAVHAVADRLAPRHAGAWRFLPCDVWGRPRELWFLE